MIKKNEKGISMITLLVTVAVLAMITITLANNSYDTTQLSKLTKLDNDIKALNDRVATYYVRNEELPIVGNAYYKSTLSAFMQDLSENDGNEYYTIDLSLLDNLTLNYGKEYQTFGGDSYIINEESHVIYRLEPIVFKDQRYHTVGKNLSVVLGI